jgi:hemerythrin HHE cation binding domain-containing protein
VSLNNAEDIVDVLSEQHHQLRQLCKEVHAATGYDKKRLFDDLEALIHLHEFGEQAVVHPVTRDHTMRGGDLVAGASAAEGERARWAILDLHDLGVDHPGFAAKFAVFRQAVLDHVAREEREEFPLLRRYIPTQRLYTMANELRNVQTMS